MPSQLIYLSNKPIRETGPKKADLRLSVDVGGMSELALVATVYEGIDVSLRVLTGMQLESDLGWTTLGTFSLLSANGADKQVWTGILRFVRWEVVSSGTTTFMIAGVARSCC